MVSTIWLMLRKKSRITRSFDPRMDRNVGRVMDSLCEVNCGENLCISFRMRGVFLATGYYRH